MMKTIDVGDYKPRLNSNSSDKASPTVSKTGLTIQRLRFTPALPVSSRHKVNLRRMPQRSNSLKQWYTNLTTK